MSDGLRDGVCEDDDEGVALGEYSDEELEDACLAREAATVGARATADDEGNPGVVEWKVEENVA